jgi:hypothetical protein
MTPTSGADADGLSVPLSGSRILRLLAAWLVFVAGVDAWGATRLVTNLNDSGPGSLRALIAASASGDVIEFAVAGTITLTSGELPIGRDLAIHGPAGGITLSGGGASRVIHVFAGNVTLSDLTIVDGRVAGRNAELAPCLYCDRSFQVVLTVPAGSAEGGGILNEGTLALVRCTVRGCTAQGGNVPTHAGEVLAGPVVAGSAEGGGIQNRGVLRMEACTVADCAAFGGSGMITLTTTVPGDAAGGGVANRGTLSLVNCTVAENRILSGCECSTDAQHLSGFSPPSAPSAATGGGLFNAGSLSVTNATIAFNEAVGGGGGSTYGGPSPGANALGGGLHSEGVFRSQNLLVAGNRAVPGTPVYFINGVIGEPGLAVVDVSGVVQSLGHNLVGIADGSSGWSGSDLSGTAISPLDPLLGALQDNDGPTLTCRPDPIGAAVDAGDDGVLPGLASDQRGYPRKSGAHVDIGAVEVDSGYATVVRTLADTGLGSLRQIIQSAPPGTTISFAPALAGKILLTSGEIVLNKDLTLLGPGADKLAVSGNSASRLFRISGGAVRIVGLALVDGREEYAAAIHNSGTLELESCRLARHLGTEAVTDGGAIASFGTLTARACTFDGNVSLANGGALAGGGGLLENCTFVGNSASRGGAAVLTGGWIVRSCTFTENLGPIYGAALWGKANGNGVSPVVQNCLIAGNRANLEPDVAGTFASGGFNLIGLLRDATGFGAAGDLLGRPAAPIDPRLGTLADHGGPCPTVALLPGSPAVDQGRSFGLATDQRGRLRPVVLPGGVLPPGGDGADMGALEVGGDEPQNDGHLVVNSLEDPGEGTAGFLRCSLRAALNVANQRPNGATISFLPGLAGVLTLRAGELTIAGAVEILGPGARVLTVNGGRASRVFRCTGGPARIRGLTLTGGAACSGGGILNAGSLTVEACTVSGNAGACSDTDSGGGVFNSGTLLLRDCTVVRNNAPSGGGVAQAGGTLDIVGCTLTANEATGPAGGGGLRAAGGAVRLLATTVAGNSAAQGGGLVAANATVIVRNTLVAGNAAAPGPDAAGTFVSAGYNLVSRVDGSTGFGLVTDVVGTLAAPVDPRLRSLGNYGGPTDTLPLGPDSPAVDTGDDALPDEPTNLTADQRGLRRRGGAHVDIGAFELNSITRTVTSLANAGPGSLRQVLADALPGDVVEFAPGVEGTIVLAGGPLMLEKDVTVRGPGAEKLAISGNGVTRVFQISFAKAEIADLTVTRGWVHGPPEGGGGDACASGGGILNVGDLRLVRCHLTANTARGQDGSAGANSEIVGANGGAGGCAAGGAILNLGALAVIASTLSSNVAIGGSGGSGGSGALAGGHGGSGGYADGGGIFHLGDTLVIEDSTISSNTAAGGGGGRGGDSAFGFGGNGGGGGAARGGGVANHGTAQLRRATLAGNASVPGSGGGHGRGDFSDGTEGAAGPAQGGGLFVESGLHVRAVLLDSLLAANQAPDGPDASGLIESQGYNLASRTNGTSGWRSTTLDRVGSVASPLDPKLGPLQENGGPTPTHALLPGSPAIDKGNGGGATSDQRGRLRPVAVATVADAAGGDGADIGAFEFQTSEVGGPLTIWHRGRVAVGGTAFSGLGQFKFALVNPDGTEEYWRNARDVAPTDGEPDQALALEVERGLFAVLLGDPGQMIPLDAAALNHPGLRLRVWFSDGLQGFQQLAPDVPVGSHFAGAASAVPFVIAYQGRVTVAGVPFTGSGWFKFALASADGTVILWRSSPDVAPADGEPDTALLYPVERGVHAALLGDPARMPPLDPLLASPSGTRLRVWFSDGVRGFQRLTPDLPLGSRPGDAVPPVSAMVPYQGRVSARGVPFSGNGRFKFALVSADGSQVHWRQAPDVSPADGVPDAAVELPVAAGSFSVLLGDPARMAALDPSVLSLPGLRLRIWFDDGTRGFQWVAPDRSLGAWNRE